MNPLALQLAREMRSNGPISFAEFMRRALYDPRHGYYESALRQIGKRGDFITSVSVGPFFGELLAFQFARWIEELLRPGENFEWKRTFQCVEAGAHDGRLAFDILEAMEEAEPKLFRAFEYWIVEPSAARREIQEKTLVRFSNVRWFPSLQEIQGRVSGVIFSNELLDAMPVHVFRWSSAAHEWNEMGVNVPGEHFVWEALERPTASAPQFPQELLEVLPDGFVFEQTAAETKQWWAEAATALTIGKLMAIDYGGTLEELLMPVRTSGTLRSYSRHRVSGSVLEDPGEQDITAHVNFSVVRQVGERMGLKTEAFVNQSQFLTNVARDLWTRRGSWPQQQVRQFQTLTHPEHLGRPFRVLVQSR